MRATGRTIGKWQWVIWAVGLIFSVGCGSGSLLRMQPPRIIPVWVNFLPDLVKGNRPSFPSFHMLVLRPVDKREAYPVKVGGILPASQDNTAILGILGLSSKEGVVRVNSQQLGAQHHMKAGIPQNPDMPRGIFTLTDLQHLIQDALEDHFRKAGFPVQKVNFTAPDEASVASEPAHYVVGCAIEEFSLVSLLRYNEVWVWSLRPHFIDMPIRGPTRANVALAVTFYRWPSGEVVWEGKVTDSVDDPPQGESEFLYGTPGEVMSMALSRAVGSILMTQSLQDVLLTR